MSFVAHRDFSEKKILILPVTIDETEITDLPWYLQGRNVANVRSSPDGADRVVEYVRQVLSQRLRRATSSGPEVGSFVSDPEIDRLIANVKLGDWESAQMAAITVLKMTDAIGLNVTFDKLLSYYESDDDDVLWQTIPVIESCVSLAPQLINYATLRKMASHENFSVRASAASICMDLANFAPDRVPVDILIKLSVFNEDWYVRAPANAALQTLAHSMPEVLRIIFARLESDNKDECAHSANVLRGIASEEPGLLDGKELEKHLVRIKKVGNREAIAHLQAAVHDVRGAKRVKRFRYGL